MLENASRLLSDRRQSGDHMSAMMALFPGCLSDASDTWRQFLDFTITDDIVWASFRNDTKKKQRIFFFSLNKYTLLLAATRIYLQEDKRQSNIKAEKAKCIFV